MGAGKASTISTSQREGGVYREAEEEDTQTGPITGRETGFLVILCQSHFFTLVFTVISESKMTIKLFCSASNCISFFLKQEFVW